MANYRKLNKNISPEKENLKSQHIKVYAEKHPRDKDQSPNHNESTPHIQGGSPISSHDIEDPINSNDAPLTPRPEVNLQPTEGVIALIPVANMDCQAGRTEARNNYTLQRMEQDFEDNYASSGGSEFVDSTQENIHTKADEFTTNKKV